METRLPMLNCLLHHTLGSLCSSSDSSKWVYAVLWRILPRNYPPPKWDYDGSDLDRSKGNKRNWILVWEDGFCDFQECERAASGYIKGSFGADIFFKLSHEVYNYGEGLIGKVAADNNHKWVFREATKESDSTSISSWNTCSIESKPKAWESQFTSGIQTIAIISVKEGIIQLGSLNKVAEDLHLVIRIQRKFSYIHTIPGIFAVQRPFISIHHQYNIKLDDHMTQTNEMSLIGSKRLSNETSQNMPIKSMNLGWNTPHSGITGAPLFPSLSCSLRALLSKLPSLLPPCNVNDHMVGNSFVNGGGAAAAFSQVRGAGGYVESPCPAHEQNRSFH